MNIPKFSRLFSLGLLAASLAATSAIAQNASDTKDIVFVPGPKASDKKGWMIKNFGPVGIGIKLEKGFVMKINNVEEGSPAAATGKLKKGQTIDSINGITLGERDPRLVLADIITEAEATDGNIHLMIQGEGPVTVTIPVLGRYSETWPLNCGKSDKIVRNLADLLAKQGKDEWGSVLFLLSTGEEKDLEVVRGWMQEEKQIGSMNWSIGIKGMGVCEYYLRTGDESVLPMIQKGADHLRDTIYNGGWSGRAASFTYQSGGHLNAAGVHCLTFLLLAQTCGVEVDEATLQSSLRHFFRYSGHGSVPYGDYTAKAGYTDCNGKTSGLALAMAAATRLTPKGEKSIYAQAAQVNAMKSYYGTNHYHMGHTGGGIGEIWKSASMGIMIDKRPQQYRDYTNARRWILELSRRHNGGIGIAGGKESNYDKATGEHNIAWGTFMGLTYTLPRKQLHLFGAPRSKWAKSHTLPERPWGTPADDAFNSPNSVPGEAWTQLDMQSESLHEHIGKPVEKLLSDPDVSDQAILVCFHHPEITHRFEARNALVRLKKDEILLGLLRSDDARLQHIGIMALHEIFGTWRKTHKDPDRVTPAMMAEVEKIIRDPNGSLFVKPWALGLLQHTDIAHLRTYKDLLVTLIEHEEHWVQGSAISASVRLLSDPASYKDLFPPIARAISNATSYPIISRARIITEKLGDADPEIQSYGLEMMKKVYQMQPNELMSERGIYQIPSGGAFKRKAIGQVVGFSEAGEDFLNSMPKLTSKWKASGRDRDRYVFSGTFQPKPVLHGTWGMLGHDQFETKEEALAFMTKKSAGKGPSLSVKKYKYGLRFSEDGQVRPLGFIKQKYDFPLRYSGDMVFGTFIDKAYQYETFRIDGQDYLMMEWDFEPEPDKDYKATFKTYVKLKGGK